MGDMMTVHRLIDLYREKNPGGHFFDRDTLRFFGERLSEMRVLKEMADVTDILGKKHRCFVLSSYQRNRPIGPKRKYTYFDSTTYRPVVMDD